VILQEIEIEADMTEKKKLEIFIEPAQEGSYITLPFDMPPETAAMRLSYAYPRYHHDANQAKSGAFTAREEINIIDLGLIAPDGRQAGASGSDKREITISESWATPGYKARELTAGRWEILVGAYKVADPGVHVAYELEFEGKQVRLLKGDLHTHTIASDGVLTLEGLGRHAVRHNLDFLAVTDHNTLTPKDALPNIEGLTMIPGVEWSHYQGHANFLGVDQPFDGPFFTHNFDETLAIFQSARERGALITINHPFEDSSPFKFDLTSVPFDALEVWNGPMRESNFRSVGLWEHLLGAGLKVPICGGSDYHRDRLFQILGGPTTCVYAQSNNPADILSAVRKGRSFITFAPEGPTLQLTCGEAIMGDSVPWETGQVLEIDLDGLEEGDVVRLVKVGESVDLFTAPSAGAFKAQHPITGPGFVRLEVWRSFLPGIPGLPALLSNPIYFDG
jgi:hypothetical protein